MVVTESVTFRAQVARCQTLADGGLRVTLDLPEDAVEAVACLMAFKRFGVVGNVTYTPEEQNGDGAGKSGKKLHI